METKKIKGITVRKGQYNGKKYIKVGIQRDLFLENKFTSQGWFNFNIKESKYGIYAEEVLMYGFIDDEVKNG